MDIDEFEEKLDSVVGMKMFEEDFSFDTVKKIAQNILNRTSLSAEEIGVVKDIYRANIDFLHATINLD